MSNKQLFSQSLWVIDQRTLGSAFIVAPRRKRRNIAAQEAFTQMHERVVGLSTGNNDRGALPLATPFLSNIARGDHMYIRYTALSLLLTFFSLSTGVAFSADNSIKVSKVDSPKKSAPAKEMDMDMDMKDCPMMRKNVKHQGYIGSAAIISNEEFSWKLSPTLVPQANKPVTFNFDFKWKKDGKPLTNLDIVHEKPCHLLVVSKDLKEFQHIHPDITGPGKMKVTTSFPKDGQYRMYLQFTPKGDGEYTLTKDFQVGKGKLENAKLQEDLKDKTVEGYTLKLPIYPTVAKQTTIVEVAIQKEGKDINYVDSFLGAGGHGAMISEDLSQFLHIHPIKTMAEGVKYKSPIAFSADVPKPGKYRAWMQFLIKDKMVIGVWDLIVKQPEP